MAYNLSLLNNKTSFPSLIDGVNDISGDKIGITLMALFFIMSFSLLKLKYDTIVAFIGSSSITLICTSILMWLGWITWYYTMIPAALLMISLVGYFFLD